MTAYVRVGSVSLSGHRRIDVARVEVDPEYRGKGMFTLFLMRVEAFALAHDLVVWVESIMNEDLDAFLDRRGYVKTGHPICPHRFLMPGGKEGAEGIEDRYHLHPTPFSEPG